MSDLNLSQIQTRLSELFVTYGERKLIFWFDPKREFEEDIDNGQIQLEGVKLYKLEPDTQFETKRYFELEDRENNYLIYAPFKKLSDNDENNHLLSLLKYSIEFSADRISLVMDQLNISNDLHETMVNYSKFFEAKSRVAAFHKYARTGVTTKQELEMVMMAVLTKANAAEFYGIVQTLLVEYASGEKTLYEQLVKFELLDTFWCYISKFYGFKSDEPTLQKLIIAFYSNAFFGQLGYEELPSSLKEFEVLDQTTAIISLMDTFMNDSRYVEAFDKLSEETYHLISGDKLMDKLSVEDLIEVDSFEDIHKRIINYYITQLLSGDITPRMKERTLDDVVKHRQRLHFGQNYSHHYDVILNAYYLLNADREADSNIFSAVVDRYESSLYKVDQYYRKFIWHMDRLTNQTDFLELQKLVEKQYKEFIDKGSQVWNDLLVLNERPSILDFYDNYANNNIKTVVIISDALRYEVAKEIQERLQSEKKYSTTMTTVFSVLPSVTEFGKAASLRGANEMFEYHSGTDVRVNGMKTQGTVARDKLLKVKNNKSLAITYDDVVSKSNAKELRETFNGQDIIYIYHDFIDKTGDHGQESEVFDAVDKTMTALHKLIPHISNGANVYRFIITSDHGFMYSRSKVEEHDKIENPSTSDLDRVERRFIISKNKYDEIGISSISLGEVLRNDDDRFIHVPKTSAIFKKAGGGQNYSHGGASPQEMLIPVLEINVNRGSSQKEQVKVQLMTPKRKIVGLSVALEFYQTEPVGETVVKTQYALYFEDDKGNRITNENSYYADSPALSTSERFTMFTFDFINRSYDTNEKVYLVMKNNETKVEEQRVEFVIDNPFAGGFGFDI